MPKLSIPNPCPVSTEQMQSTERGSFCQQCQKEVIDFRSMSDEAVLRYMKQASGRVCGKFHPSQLDRPMRKRPVRSRWRIASLLGILTLGTGLAQAQSKDKQDTVQTDPRAYSYLINDKPSPKIFGQVLDSYGDPLEFATVWVSGTQLVAFTDHDGRFDIALLQADPIDLDSLSIEVRYPGMSYGQQQVTPNVFVLIELTKSEEIWMGIVLYESSSTPWQRFRHRVTAPFYRLANWLRFRLN